MENKLPPSKIDYSALPGSNGSYFSASGGGYCELWSGTRCDLFFPQARLYKWHAVAAIQEFLPRKRFSHVTEQQINKAFGNPERSGFISNIASTWDAESFYRVIIMDYGLFCASCKVIHEFGKNLKINRHYPTDQASTWSKFDVCEPCAEDLRLSGWRAIEKERKARELSVYLSKKRIEQDGQREQNRLRAQTRRRIERAAYSVMEELGLIDELERRL